MSTPQGVVESSLFLSDRASVIHTPHTTNAHQSTPPSLRLSWPGEAVTTQAGRAQHAHAQLCWEEYQWTGLMGDDPTCASTTCHPSSHSIDTLLSKAVHEQAVVRGMLAGG